MQALEQIECPNCHHHFPLTAALSGNVEALVAEKYKSIIAEQEAKFKKLIGNLEKQNSDALLAKEQESIALKKKLEKEIEDKLAKKSQIEKEDLKNQLEEEKKRADEAQAREIELRKRERELQSQKKDMELQIERKLDEQSKILVSETEKRIQELYDKKLSEANYKNEQMQKMLEEANRKASQGSQQVQGEILEKKFEEVLPETFENDEFTPVPKGKNGSDIIHVVKTKSGNKAGQISIETKDTINFSEKWIEKLKEDQRSEGSDLAIIISKAKPEGMKSDIDLREGVWIVTPNLAIAAIGMLREQLLRVHQVKMANAIPADQKEEIFQLLTGTKFKQSMEAEVELISTMLEELTKEQSVAFKLFKSRETRLNKLLSSKAALYGDLQGILGRSLPVIEKFELAAPNEEEK